MSFDNSPTLPSQLINIDANLNFPPNYNTSESIDIRSPLRRNFSLDSIEEDNDSIQQINHPNSMNFISSIRDPNPMPSSIEISNIIPYVPINSNKQSDSISSSDFANSVTKYESKSISDKENNKENLIGKKRQRARKEDKDDIRVKIKRAFYNISLRNKLNNKLKSIGSKKYFEKFPKYFASDPNKKRNKEILNMTLNQIFAKKELYNYEDDCGKTKYLHNLKTVQNEEIKKNEEFQKILNKTFRELYEEYINSDEFKIDEINRLKKKNRDEYIKKYKELAENLIEFFSD
jgi:hypothetical protein